MSNKRKSYEENPFAADLLPNEQILWMGQPDRSRIFTGYDVFLIPFSLVWCAFIIPMVLNMLARGEFIAIVCPHLWVGVYFLAGRFIHDLWRKRHTYYAVTDRRLLTLKTGWGHHLQAMYINRLPDLNKSVGLKGVGSITFGSSQKWWMQRQNNWSFDNGQPGFHQIQDANEIYALINELRDEYMQAQPTEADVWQYDEGKAKRRR